MGNVKNYIKRGIKYILNEHTQPIVKVEVFQKNYEKIFNDKIFLVTGGSSGIGYCIAEKLVQENSFVIITGRNEDKLKSALNKLGTNCEYIVYDVRDIDKASQTIEYIYEKYGKLDGLINNAGVSLHEWDFLKVTPEGFDKQFYTNLKGSFFLTQSYVEKVITNRKAGNVIFISSERGSMADVIPYGLSKASINSLVQGLSYQYYKQGIRFNAVAPGVTVSDMTKIKKEDDLYSDNNSGRIFMPEEVAEIVTYLLSDYSKCISGEIIHCNGGNQIKLGW